MNELAHFVQDHPAVLESLVSEGERVSLKRLTDVLQASGFPYALTHDVNVALIRRQPLGHILPTAYLGVVEVEGWRSRLEHADPTEREGRDPLSMTEWVTFASADGSARGLSLPQDDDPSPRVSLFARGEGSLQRVSIEYRRGQGLPTGLSVSLAHGCSLPDWGECRGDDCSGDCRLERVRNDENGLICRCPHLEDLADAYHASAGELVTG